MDDRSRRVERAFEWPILVAALLVIPVIVIEQSDLGDPWRSLAAVANWAIWLAFATELIVMLIVVPEKWNWLRRHPLEVAVVVLRHLFCQRRYKLPACSGCSGCFDSFGSHRLRVASSRSMGFVTPRFLSA
jgi:hypothetical protein